MKKIIILFFALIILASCRKNAPEYIMPEETLDNSVTTVTTQEIYASEMTITDNLPMFTFEASITDGLPTFMFEVYENVVDDTFFQYIYDIHILCPELSEYSPQSLKLFSGLKWDEEFREHYIDLVDIDFDGYVDLQVAKSKGNANTFYEYYRWSVFIGQGYGEFEQEPFFSMLTTGYQLHPDTKQIINLVYDNAVNHPRELYQLGNTRNGGWQGEYKMIRREEQEFVQSENGENKVIARVYFEDEEIYTETVLVEGHEYDISSIGDNFLRFGIDNPIGKEAAVRLLQQEYGEADSCTGFPFSFWFEEMFLYENLSCYKFRVQWLVDGNHWSTINFSGVTPDGRLVDANE